MSLYFKMETETSLNFIFTEFSIKAKNFSLGKLQPLCLIRLQIISHFLPQMWYSPRGSYIISPAGTLGIMYTTCHIVHQHCMNEGQTQFSMKMSLTVIDILHKGLPNKQSDLGCNLCCRSGPFKCHSHGSMTILLFSNG